MKNKKILNSISSVAIALISLNIFAYKCSSTQCSTGNIIIKHDATIQPTLECTGKYLFAKGWNYTRSSKIVLCTTLWHITNSNSTIITCHNWNTIWGSTHTINITWKCSKTGSFNPPGPS